MVLDVSSNSGQITQVVTQFTADSQRKAKGTKQLANVLFGNLAKVDHIVFINKLYEYVNARGNMTYNPVDHHNCRLGKWYETGMGYYEYRDLPSYAKLLQPHEKVHSNAVQIKEMPVDNEHVWEVASLLHDVNAASAIVNETLDRLVQEKNSEGVKQEV